MRYALTRGSEPERVITAEVGHEITDVVLTCALSRIFYIAISSILSVAGLAQSVER